MRKISFLFHLCFLLFFANGVMAQKIATLQGVVTDKETKEPLPGVTLHINGTTINAITDINGRFKMSNINKGSTLNASYLGMKPIAIKVGDSKELLIEMNKDVMQLEEAVVVGYGTARKRDVTGSIVTIKGDELKTAPSYSPVNALQGKVPGLMITNSGDAGGSPSILIRGVATLKAGTKPLFVVDGMLTDNIDFISANDIVSIEVLKDPSSLAIFGVQGANGVIILSTKRAKEGSMNVSYDGFGGVQYVSQNDRVKLTNATQFSELYNELLKNQATSTRPYVPWTPELLGKGTDWVDAVLRPAAITSHNVTITNSTEKSSSVLSLGYFFQDGVLKYDNYNRFNLRYANDYNITRNIKIGSNVVLSRWSKTQPSANIWEAVRAIPNYLPYAPEKDFDPKNPGSVFTPSPSIQKDLANPVANMELNKGKGENYGYRGVGNAYLELSFLKDFKFKAIGYMDLGINFGSQFSPKYNVNNSSSISSQRRDVNSFSRNVAEFEKYQSDFLLSYTKKIEKHKIDLTAGYTAYLKKEKGFSASADSIGGKNMDIVPEDFWMLSQGSPQKMSVGDWYSSETFISYLGRLSYSYMDKYLLTATIRKDGSSKFSPKNRWGYFPSLGLGWIISEESFMNGLKESIDFLKLKASYGQLGNDKIGNYLWFPTVNPTGQQVIIDGKVYYIPTQEYLVDENIHWEVMSGLDFGIEGKLANNRLNFELGYYTKTTRDLLAFVPPSVSVGAGYAITNAGSIQNRGVEFILGWNDKIGDIGYSISMNGATLKNKVLELGNNNSDIISGDYHRTSVGQTVGSFYGYKQEGIFQNQQEVNSYLAEYKTTWVPKPGDIKYQDLNGDKKIDDKDRTFLGSPLPTFTYGMSARIDYKGFDLSVELNGVYGNKILNSKKLSSYSQFNFYQSALGRWNGEGTSSVEPILDYTRSHNYLSSTNLLEDGSYLRIRSLQLGYNFSTKSLKKIGVGKLRVFVNSQNPFTFKKNTGFTPEIGGGSPLDGGVDGGGTYPIPSTYTAGLSLNF